MPLIDLTVKHGRTPAEARLRLEHAVAEATRTFGGMVRRTEWSADRDRVRLDGVGFWTELWVDAEEVHAIGDIPLLGGLLGGPVAAGLKQIVQRSFAKP